MVAPSWPALSDSDKIRSPAGRRVQNARRQAGQRWRAQRTHDARASVRISSAMARLVTFSSGASFRARSRFRSQFGFLGARLSRS